MGEPTLYNFNGTFAYLDILYAMHISHIFYASSQVTILSLYNKNAVGRELTFSSLRNVLQLESHADSSKHHLELPLVSGRDILHLAHLHLPNVDIESHQPFQ